jgi:UDP-N-acetylmuramate--alanine ligase
MNALASWRLAENLGIKEETIKKALSGYKGIWRRIEYKGTTSKGVKVYDDYAHHPTEIRATLQALREKFPKSKIVCVLQPHQNKRLVSLYRDFIGSFSDADYVLLPDVYNPKGRDEVSETKNSETLAKDVNKITPNKALYIGAEKNIPKALKNIPLKRGDVAVLMGAGTIDNITPLLLK